MKELRLRAGLTQARVAEIIEVDQGAVSHWERGKYTPTRKYRKKLAELYGCTVDELMEEKAKPENPAQ